MTRRAALAVLPVVLALTGCAGTDPASSSTSSSAASSSAASSSAAPSSASGSASAPDPAEQPGRRVEVTVEGGRVSGDTGRVPVPLGEPVTLVVTADAADEVHVHGYDLTVAVAPGEPATVPVPADVPGVFEVELHEAGTVLLTLQVG